MAFKDGSGDFLTERSLDRHFPSWLVSAGVALSHHAHRFGASLSTVMRGGSPLGGDE